VKGREKKIELTRILNIYYFVFFNCSGDYTMTLRLIKNTTHQDSIHYQALSKQSLEEWTFTFKGNLVVVLLLIQWIIILFMLSFIAVIWKMKS